MSDIKPLSFFLRKPAVLSLYRSFVRLIIPLRTPEMLLRVREDFRKSLVDTVEEGGCLNEDDAFNKRMEVGRRELRLLEVGMGVGKRGVTMSEEDMRRMEEEADEEEDVGVGVGWPWERKD
jgi:hypothetical protein